jgi:gas vesicle protein
MRYGNYEPSERGSVGTAITFLMIGLGIGAFTALLLTPKTGTQMRRALRRRYEDGREAFDDWTEDLRGRAEEVIERGAEIAREVGEAARERGESVRKAVQRG